MTEVFWGKNSIRKIGQIFEKEKFQSVLIVSNSSFYESCGAKNLIESQINKCKTYYYDQKSKIPAIEDMKTLATFLNDKKIDLIICVGGGSVLDVVKGAYIIRYDISHSKEIIENNTTVSDRSPIKKIYIPTTAGTGAETTPFAVIYINGTKYSLVNRAMIPDFVILSSNLTEMLPSVVAAQSGFDSLAQGIESYWSINSTVESRRYSKKAIELSMLNLEKVVLSPNQENRRAMLKAAYYSGKAIAIAKTTAAHSLSYPLTSNFGITHGHAVSLTLPYFFPINNAATQENIQEGFTVAKSKKNFANLLKIMDVESAEEAKKKLIDLIDNIGLERKLRNLGVNKCDIKKIIDEGFNPQRIKNNPVIVTRPMVEEIFNKIF